MGGEGGGVRVRFSYVEIGSSGAGLGSQKFVGIIIFT